jgi:broad specificity phosphatase PhoE
VSDDRRAQQTAAPLAQRLHRAPQPFSAGDVRSAVARVLHEHAGGTVLVIGSGAAVPQMIHELNGADVVVAAAPGESDILYVVSVPSFGRAHLVRIRL